MIAVHPTHRKLAEITFMNTDRNGVLSIGDAELKLILSLLRENLKLVHQLDSLKELSFVAYQLGEMGWVADISKQIDELEVQCI